MAKSFLDTPGYPLGLRNNNPGNIRPGDNWVGMIGVSGNFVRFQDIEYGIRAMATDIGNDIRLKGYNTIRKIVNEYAPPSENDTAAYINNMVRYTGIGADQVLSNDQATLSKLIRAHMNIELGPTFSAKISDRDIAAGLAKLNPTLLDYFKIGVAPAVGFGVLLVASAAVFFYVRSRRRK